jgi:hypothetical protein
VIAMTAAPGHAVEEIWSRFTDDETGADFTGIYPFVAGFEQHPASGSVT